MKVKIGNQIFDSSETPIMLVMDKSDKENIANMSPEATKYVSFPDKIEIGDIKEWMKIS